MKTVAEGRSGEDNFPVLRNIFSSIYFLTFITSFLCAVAVGLWTTYHDNASFVQERRNLEKQEAISLLKTIKMHWSHNLDETHSELQKAMALANYRQQEFEFQNGGIYRSAQIMPTGTTFDVVRKYPESGLFLAPDVLTLTSTDISRGGRSSKATTQYWTATGDARSSDLLILVTVQDGRLKSLLQARTLHSWLNLGGIYVLFYIIAAIMIRWIILRPMSRLENMLSDEQIDPAVAVRPEDFGDFSDLAQAISACVKRVRAAATASREVDPITGFLSGQAAVREYLAVRHQPQEIFACFFRANFAKEFVKKHGLMFRDRILTCVSESLTEGLPPGRTAYAVPGHLLMVFLPSDEFTSCYSSVQFGFRQRSARIYGKHPPDRPLTLSAICVSNKSMGYLSFDETLQQIHAEWNSRVDRAVGGWAMMDATDEWAKGVPEDIEDDIIPENPEAMADPAFARKLFIIKLAFMFQFDPKKAAKLFQLGFRTIPSLLDEKSIDAVKKHGLATDLQELAGKMRLFPRKRLAYTEADFRQVFVTDVRFVRKIPSPIIQRWFQSGYRRIEDLGDAAAGELHKIDSTANITDIEAVVQHAHGLKRATQAPAS